MLANVSMLSDDVSCLEVLRAIACGVDCCGGDAEAATSWVIGAGDMMS
jgi:hypothetical protein